MEKIAIISDVHGNITALEAVLKDIEARKIKRIFCLGDSTVKGPNPDKVVDILREKCEVMLIGNTDYSICTPEVKNKGYWTRNKIGEERANYLYHLPKMYEFYLSGELVRLFHATPYSLEEIFNPVFSNDITSYKNKVITNPEEMFKNTEFLGLAQDAQEPDIIGYGHIHTPLIFKYGNRTIFNTGSVGVPVEMSNNNRDDEKNRFSTVASYMILEGEYNNKEFGVISFTQVRVPYDIKREIKNIVDSDIPNKKNIITSIETAISEEIMNNNNK